MKTRCALILTLLMLTLPYASAQPSAPGEGIDYRREEIEIVRDDAAGLVKMRIGEAHMSVEYGENVGISMMTVQTSYLGVADMYDEDQKFHHRLGIPVHHIMWQRLVGTLEYIDTNENGLFDIDAAHAIGTLDELERTAGDHEEILRYVDYRDVEWILSEWSEVKVGNEVAIDFVLSAENIPYGNRGDGSVARIAYLFHVTTVEEDIQVIAVPHFRVDYSGESNHPQILGSDLLAQTNVTGHVLNTTWKYDQHIEGWDVSERNDTRLFTISEMAMGAKLNRAAGDWMRMEYDHLVRPQAFAGQVTKSMDDTTEMLDGHDKQGNPLKCGLAYVEGISSDNIENNDEDSDRVREKMRHYQETECRQRGEEIAAGHVDKPEVIRAGALHFDDGGANRGRIRWVSNATVDDVETEVLFQLHGVRPVIREDIAGMDALYIGVRMVGGYNYVSGNESYHDPEFGVDVLTLETMSFSQPTDGKSSPLRLLMLGAALLVVLVAMGTVSRRRQEAPIPDSSYAPIGGWTQQDADWEQYRES